MKIIRKNDGVHYEFDTTAKPLGEGGMGVVYRGWRFDNVSSQPREVAIKELKPVPAHIVERARREASLRIRHDSLIEMIDFVEIITKDELGCPITRFYVISEYLRGVSLRSLIKGKVTDYQGDVIPFAQELYCKMLNNPYQFTLIIIRSLLSGLMALHDTGYIHRDIDPSNIMVTAEGNVKLIDFGIAKKISEGFSNESSYTRTGEILGKLEYISPEQAKGMTSMLGPASDLYSVGILLYELLLGHLPYGGDVMKIQNDVMPLREVRQFKLKKVLRKATEKQIAKRFQSAAEFRAEIDKLYLLPYPEKSHKTLIVAATIVVVGSASFLLYKSNQKPNAISYAQAVALLGNEVNAQKGFDYLLELATNGSHVSKNESYQAKYLLSRLYFSYDVDSSEQPDSIKQYRTRLGISSDNVKSHKLLEEAISLIDNDYHSLYELGCNYMSSNKRGANKDLEKAKNYLTKALKEAEYAGDKIYQNRIIKRLELLK